MVRKLKANHPERLCGENHMRVSKFSIGKAEENRKMKLWFISLFSALWWNILHWKGQLMYLESWCTIWYTLNQFSEIQLKMQDCMVGHLGPLWHGSIPRTRHCIRKNALIYVSVTFRTTKHWHYPLLRPFLIIRGK